MGRALLDDLHRHHLIHGNITPKNVLMRHSDHLTKLADLQVGKALAGSKMYATVAEKKAAAELPYLAPEQAEPGAFVDDSADLYAVGAVAYALATGRPPVTGRTPDEVREAVRAGRVTKPSGVYRKVPAAFEAILLKMLAHDQADRYPSPAALLEDLEPLAQFPESGR
jgi:serine/threonine protein kinase